jgi:hypothetical protein
MTRKDQQLISETYVNEIFGFNKTDNTIELKNELDPETFETVKNVFSHVEALKKPNPFVKVCSANSCVIDPKYISKACNILKSLYKKEYVNGGNEMTDRIIDTHDALMQLSVGNYEPHHNTPPETGIYR